MIVATGSGTPFALIGDGYEGLAMAAGKALTIARLVILYRWTAKVAARLT